MTNLIGPDISFYQDDPTTPLVHIDFSKMSENANFVVIRAGQSSWPDRDFKVNWLAAKGVLPRSSYWFYDSRKSPKEQADLWLHLLDGDFGEMHRLWCDFEEKYLGPYGGRANFETFMEILRTMSNGQYTLGVYTGYYYWHGILSGATEKQRAYFAQYPCWIAAYNNVGPQVPPPWKEWEFWQFTDKGPGKIYGVESGNIDLNYFNGNIDDFNQRFNIVSTPTRTLTARFENSIVQYKEK